MARITNMDGLLLENVWCEKGSLEDIAVVNIGPLRASHSTTLSKRNPPKFYDCACASLYPSSGEGRHLEGSEFCTMTDSAPP